ncbi:MAG: lysylphosphatidylglycerol synthase transmembrane domain-containing protein [Deltaproteobacteria bacterium]|nr:lysylphosphatidylglycerol synthase transmembrane domain-containing protein [Deltaproteobacteria bacterium]
MAFSGLKLALSIGILVLLARKLDLDKLEATWAAANLLWLVPVMLVKGTGIFSAILRWRWLLRGQDLEVPLRHLIGSFLVGRFIGIVVPSTIGLDGYRAYDIARHAKAPARSIAVILVEKVIGLFALGLLVLVTLPGGQRFVPTEGLVSLFGVFFVPVGLAFFLLVKPGAVEALNRWFVPRFFGLRDKIGKAAEAAGRFAHQRKVLGIATFYGVLVHLCTASMYLFTAEAVGADIKASEILFVAPLMIVATLVPVSFSGFGVREGAFVFLLSRIGVPVEQAALLGTLGFIGGEAFSLLGGLVFVTRGRDYAPQIEELSAGVRAIDIFPEEAEGATTTDEVLSEPEPALAAGGES